MQRPSPESPSTSAVLAASLKRSRSPSRSPPPSSIDWQRASRRRLDDDDIKFEADFASPASSSSCRRFLKPAAWFWPDLAPSLSSQASAASAQVLRLLGRPSVGRIPWALEQALFARDNRVAVAPSLVLEVCGKFNLSLSDVEAIALPPWNFNLRFQDKITFFAYIDPCQEPLEVGEAAAYWSSTYESWVGATVTGRHLERGSGSLGSTDAVNSKPRQTRSGQSAVVGPQVLAYDLDVRGNAEPCRLRRQTLLTPGHPSRARMVSAATQAAGGALSIAGCLGEAYGINVPGPCGLTYCSARWAELLDGGVLARLMTDSCPTDRKSVV